MPPAAVQLESSDPGPLPPHRSPPSHTCDNAGMPTVATPAPARAPSIPATKAKPKIDKQSIDYMVRSAIAGGAAGCVAKTLIAPLDRVKILFQASNPQFIKYTGSWSGVLSAVHEIRSTSGILGLYRGHSATLLRIFPYAAVKFVAYEQIRHILISSPEQETTVRRFLAGSLAGVTSVFFTYPLEVLRVRLAFETRPGHTHTLLSLVKKIWREPQTSAVGGISNFYRGFSPTILGMLPYAGMSFLTHDLLIDLFRSPLLAPYTIKPDSTVSTQRGGKKHQLKAWAELAAGGLAGMASQTASYPLEVIRRRMQVGGARGERRFTGIKETARGIARDAGWRGFWVGLSIGYVKVVPMVATSFFVYERMKGVLGIA